MGEGAVHLQFGSPFHLNASVQAAETVQDAPPGLPVVLWDVPNGMSGGSRSGRPDELVPATTAVTSAAPAAGRHSPLGCVTFCIRGQTSGEKQPDAEDAAVQQAPQRRTSCSTGRRLSGFSVRAARIVAHAGGHCLLVPIACEKSIPAGNEAETAAPMTLTAWLKLARRESQRKAPLPRHWQSLSLERLAELAEERGLHHSEKSSKIQLVKFLRDNWAADK